MRISLVSAGIGNLTSGGDPVNLTPSQKDSFLAGIGLWVLIWAPIWKADDIAQAMRIQQWFNSSRCIRWIGQHKSTSRQSKRSSVQSFPAPWRQKGVCSNLQLAPE